MHCIRRAMAHPGLRVDLEDHYEAFNRQRRGVRSTTRLFWMKVDDLIRIHGLGHLFEIRPEGTLIYHGNPVRDWWPFSEMYEEDYYPQHLSLRGHPQHPRNRPGPLVTQTPRKTLWDHLEES